jgi:hypothetical protein
MRALRKLAPQLNSSSSSPARMSAVGFEMRTASTALSIFSCSLAGAPEGLAVIFSPVRSSVVVYGRPSAKAAGREEAGRKQHQIRCFFQTIMMTCAHAGDALLGHHREVHCRCCSRRMTADWDPQL